MPKVLRILNRFNLGGPTYNAVYLTKYMAPEFETLLIGGDKEESEESSLFIAEQEGIKPIIVPEMKRSINPFQDAKALKKIKAIIEDFKPDIVHTHASKAGVLGRRVAFKAKVPVVVHTFHGHVFHSYFNPVKTAIIKKIERSLAQKSNAIVAISNEQKRELVEQFNICKEEKTHVIPLGFDLNKYTIDMVQKRRQFRSKYLIEEDEVVVTIVGRLVPVKNHDFFVEVVHKVLQQCKNKVRFFIVGDGEERQNILNKLTAMRLDHCYWPSENRRATVTLTSWHKDIDVVNAGSDIITLTSLNEGTPVSLIEAQAACKPLVSTRVGGINNIVLENKSAFLCDSGSSEDFAFNLLQLIDNENIRRDMAGAAQAFVLEHFSHTALCQKMTLLYHKLLNKA
jgi:glycosyltransferase involved in cell wall biosynthesis